VSPYVNLQETVTSTRQNMSAFSRRFLTFFGNGRTRHCKRLQETELNLARALPSSLCRDDVGTNAARSARDCPGPVLPRRAQIAMGAEAICSRACAAAARILNVHDELLNTTEASNPNGSESKALAGCAPTPSS
jgi:hypothetical protein